MLILRKFKVNFLIEVQTRKSFITQGIDIDYVNVVEPTTLQELKESLKRGYVDFDEDTETIVDIEKEIMYGNVSYEISEIE